MGNPPTAQPLIRRWGELCADRSLRDLPYKVELNSWGKLEMTALSNRRGLLVGRLASEFHKQLPGGIPLIGCGVLTSKGVSVADVAWACNDLMAVYQDALLFEQAPDICVEVCTADGEEKVSAYLAAGAKEVWLVSEDGSLSYFDAGGQLMRTGFPLVVGLPPLMEMQ